jgi:hypothetical protein
MKKINRENNFIENKSKVIKIKNKIINKLLNSNLFKKVNK